MSKSFKSYIKKINQNIDNGNILIVMEILKQIKYYIEAIINQKSNNLIKIYTKCILCFTKFCKICIITISYK